MLCSAPFSESMPDFRLSTKSVPPSPSSSAALLPMSGSFLPAALSSSRPPSRLLTPSSTTSRLILLKSSSVPSPSAFNWYARSWNRPSIVASSGTSPRKPPFTCRRALLRSCRNPLGRNGSLTPYSLPSSMPAWIGAVVLAALTV